MYKISISEKTCINTREIKKKSNNKRNNSEIKSVTKPGLITRLLQLFFFSYVSFVKHINIDISVVICS